MRSPTPKLQSTPSRSSGHLCDGFAETKTRTLDTTVAPALRSTLLTIPSVPASLRPSTARSLRLNPFEPRTRLRLDSTIASFLFSSTAITFRHRKFRSTSAAIFHIRGTAISTQYVCTVPAQRGVRRYRFSSDTSTSTTTTSRTAHYESVETLRTTRPVG